MLLEKKTAVITGCLKGIGFEAMRLFASEGADILACFQHEEAGLDERRKEIVAKTGVKITPCYFDLSDEEQIKTSMRALMSTKPKIDILLNIAGMTQDSLFQMTTIENMRRVMEINFMAQMLVTQYVSKAMVRQKSGSIISVSSVTAMDGNSGQLSYGASKAGLIGAMRTLATELAPYNVRVNAIAPGVIDTDMTASLPADALKKLHDRIPMSRLGLASEVASVMLFFASDLSTYITGQVLRIDGGIG